MENQDGTCRIRAKSINVKLAICIEEETSRSLGLYIYGIWYIYVLMCMRPMWTGKESLKGGSNGKIWVRFMCSNVLLFLFIDLYSFFFFFFLGY
jgi:hypothetical protein